MYQRKEVIRMYQKIEISKEQIEVLSIFIFSNVLNYCNENSKEFYLFKKNLKGGLRYEY